jgi:hypothetical protein
MFFHNVFSVDKLGPSDPATDLLGLWLPVVDCGLDQASRTRFHSSYPGRKYEVERVGLNPATTTRNNADRSEPHWKTKSTQTVGHIQVLTSMPLDTEKLTLENVSVPPVALSLQMGIEHSHLGKASTSQHTCKCQHVRSVWKLLQKRQ